MSLKDDDKIRDYLHRCDDPYRLVTGIASIARERSNSLDYDNHILESDALSWVIQGKEPDYISEYECNKIQSNIQREVALLKDELCYIDDISVKQSVKTSIFKYIQTKHKQYVYSNCLSETNKRRVRIIVNMIVDKIKQLNCR